jgi:predicted nucleotidyltransferase
MYERERLVAQLRALSEREPEIVLSFLFGSHATGRSTAYSDVDVAVYLRHTKKEDRIWAEI